jgi:acetylornithine deacetylase/succinyl-diaminopimelate desuccinylase-like protein
MLSKDNAVAKLAAAVTRLGQHSFPQVITPPVREFLDGVAEITGQPFDEDDLETALGRLGGIARIIGATLRDTANVTMFNAGYRANVVPSTATAEVDVRFLPGCEEIIQKELLEILGPDIEASWPPGLAPVQTTFDGALVDHMTLAIQAEDPGARLLLLRAGLRLGKQLVPRGRERGQQAGLAAEVILTPGQHLDSVQLSACTDGRRRSSC